MYQHNMDLNTKPVQLKKKKDNKIPKNKEG